MWKARYALRRRENLAAMTKFSIRILALMLLMSVGASAQQAAPDPKGTWSGTFVSSNADISPFTIAVKINKDLSEYRIGESSQFYL